MRQTEKAAWTRLIALVLTMALLLAGCGSGGSAADGSSDKSEEGASSSAVDPAEDGTEDEPAAGTEDANLSEEERTLLRRTGLAMGDSFGISGADASKIKGAVAGMRAAYVAGPGGEDPLVAERDWSVYSSSLGKANLPRREAAYYDRLDEMCLKYLSTSGLDGVRHTIDGTVYYATDGVKFNDLGLTQETAASVLYWFTYNNPQYYFIKNCWLQTEDALFPCLYDFAADGEARAKITNELFDKLEGWVQTVDSQASTTYQKELYANNLICEAVTYDYDSYNKSIQGVDDTGMSICQSLYSVVMLENTVCAGYSKAFTAMMSALGVEATAGLKSGNHAWNVVRFDDGNYYCVDVCWNDTDSSPSYNNDYLNVGESSLQGTSSRLEYHTYSDDVAAWIPAIAERDYVPTSADTNPPSKNPGTSATKAPQVRVTNTTGTTITFSVDNLDGRLRVRTYQDADHKLVLDAFILSGTPTSYSFAGLQPNTTYYFAFGARKTVDGQNHDSDWVYLQATTASTVDPGEADKYPAAPVAENIRSASAYADGFRMEWDPIVQPDYASVYCYICLYTDSTCTKIKEIYSIGLEDNFYDWSGMTPGETYYFGIRTLRIGGGMSIYSDWHNYYYTP